MTTQSPNAPLALAQIPILLRGEPGPMRFWIAEWQPARMCLYVALVIAGTAAFGMVVGAWRHPVQGLYNAIKFPLIVLMTAVGNGLLNGMLAPLLGTNISFRQSLVAVAMSFTIAAAVLGACSPIVAFVIWNAPALATSADSRMTHSFILITVVAVIAVAGSAANVRLWHLLRQLSGSDSSAVWTVLVWLAGNLLLGSQISWILRPFVGSPMLPVQFLRDDALHGNFFESVFRSLQRLFS